MIGPSALPFMINTRLDSIAETLAYGNIYEAQFQVNEVRRLLKEAQTVAIAFKDFTMMPIIKDISMFMSLAARKLFLNEVIGAHWCFSQIRKMTGYTPTPCIWIPGKLNQKAVNTNYF